MMAPGIGGANRLCRLGQRAIDTSPRHSARTDRCAPTRISPHGVPSPPHPAVPKRSAASLALPMAGRRQLRSCGCGPRPPCRFDLKRIMYRSKFDTNCRSSIMNPSIGAAVGTMDMDRQRDPLRSFRKSCRRPTSSPGPSSRWRRHEHHTTIARDNRPNLLPISAGPGGEPSRTRAATAHAKATALAGERAIADTLEAAYRASAGKRNARNTAKR